MLSLALGARRKARGDSASWPRQCATSSMRPYRQPSGVSTAYEPLRSRRRPPRHIKTTTTPGRWGTTEAGAGPVNGGVREHSRLEEYARSG